jgi:hypothetical protein
MGLPWDASTAASYYVVDCFICIEEIERPGGHLFERRDKQEKIRKIDGALQTDRIGILFVQILANLSFSFIKFFVRIIAKM